MKYSRRFSVDEINFTRIGAAVKRRYEALPHRFAWRFSSFSQENKTRLQAFKECHKGQRCVIMGNGPSLAQMDLTPLKNASVGLLFPKILVKSFVIPLPLPNIILQ